MNTDKYFSIAMLMLTISLLTDVVRSPSILHGIFQFGDVVLVVLIWVYATRKRKPEESYEEHITAEIDKMDDRWYVGQ